jgi:hypothetical protein
MKTSTIAILAAIGLTLTTFGPARAQTKPSPTGGQTYTGQSVTAAIQGSTPATQPRPIATIGNINVGVWAPVQAPYNANNNRTQAANPIWREDMAPASGF